jgi:hypothetical protein
MHSTTALATLIVHVLGKDKAWMGQLQALMAGLAALFGGLLLPRLLPLLQARFGDRWPADVSLLIGADLTYGICW